MDKEVSNSNKTETQCGWLRLKTPTPSQASLFSLIFLTRTHGRAFFQGGHFCLFQGKPKGNQSNRVLSLRQARMVTMPCLRAVLNCAMMLSVASCYPPRVHAAMEPHVSGPGRHFPSWALMEFHVKKDGNHPRGWTKSLVGGVSHYLRLTPMCRGQCELV